MSTFTIMLNDLIESGFDLGLGPSDYPIFDETYRTSLNRKITDHYAFYEIGQETEGIFKFSLNRRMREIMPLYNQLYMSEKIAFDPLSTMDFTEHGVSSADVATTGHLEADQLDHTTSDTTAHGTTDTVGHSDNDSTTGGTTDTVTGAESTSTSTSESRSRSVNSELPQVHLSPDEDYATNANDSVGNTTNNGSGTSDSTVGEVSAGTASGSTDSTGNETTDSTVGEVADSTGSTTQDTTGSELSSGTLNRTMQGYQGHAAELLMRYRESLMNIDMMVINDLNNLFMGVWDNGDEFSTTNRNYYGRSYFPI